MSPDPKISAVAYVIQLSVSPVFFLSGVSVTLSVLINRLARVIDRARNLEERAEQAGAEVHREELDLLTKRAMCIQRAVTQSVACALILCLTIITLFVGAFYTLDLSWLIASLFVLSLLAFFGSLLSFLREIFLATDSLRFGAPPK